MFGDVNKCSVFREIYHALSPRLLTAVSFLLTVLFARKKGLMQSALNYTLGAGGPVGSCLKEMRGDIAKYVRRNTRDKLDWLLADTHDDTIGSHNANNFLSSFHRFLAYFYSTLQGFELLKAVK